MNRNHRDDQREARSAETLSETGQTRRGIVRAGIKLAFVAPVVSTFLAEDAMAVGSNHSCYPAGHACGGATLESCCPGLTCTALTCQ
jgi:hypothetical protein